MNNIKMPSGTLQLVVGYLNLMRLVILFSLVKSVSLLDMVSEGEQKVVNQKTNISLSCEFFSYNFNLFDNPVLWKKIQRGEETQINMMSNIYQPYANKDRFSVTFMPRPPTYRLDLTIINVSPEDSGNYTCEIRGPASSIMASVTHYIFVRAHVETLGITDSNSSTIPQPKRSITFIEGSSNKLRCVSTGGYPPPEMRVYIGNVDISNQLQWYQFPKLKGRKGLRLMTYYSERWSLNFDAKPQYDGQEVTCAVDVPGYGRNHTLAILHVHYSPVIRCYDTPASVGDEIVQLACDIWAKPRIISSYWVIDKNGTTVSVPSVVDEYWSQVQDQKNGAIRNSLFLHVVKRSSFRKYTLIAENDVGVTTHAVDLIEKIVPTITARIGSRVRSDTSSLNDGYKRNYYINRPRNNAFTIHTGKTHLLLLFSIVMLLIPVVTHSVILLDNNQNNAMRHTTILSLTNSL